MHTQVPLQQWQFRGPLPADQRGRSQGGNGGTPGPAAAAGTVVGVGSEGGEGGEGVDLCHDGVTLVPSHSVEHCQCFHNLSP